MKIINNVMAIAAATLIVGSVQAAPMFYTNAVAWQNAADAAAVGGTATQQLEDLETIPLGTHLVGPLSFHGGSTMTTLNTPGNAGSDVHIQNTGSSNTLAIELDHDTSDIVLPFPPFTATPNDGVESIDFAFSVPGAQVLGFAFDLIDAQTDDGLLLNVNGASYQVSQLVGLNSSGFFGVVDATGISLATLLPDNLNNNTALDTFEEAELDNLWIAYETTTTQPPTDVPAPGLPLLLVAGLLGWSLTRRITTTK